MSEQIEEHFLLTVEATGSYGGHPSKTPGTISVAPEFGRAVVDSVRALAAKRLARNVELLVELLDGDPDQPHTALDFTAPNSVTKDQIEHELLNKAQRIVEALEVLRELAPWTLDDDDDDEDPDPSPEPDPEPAETA